MSNVQLFIDAALKHSESTGNGDYLSANESYKKMKKLADKDTNHQLLLKLLNHEKTAVRLWAATFLIDFKPEISRKVLRQIIKLNEPFHSFSAEILLSEKE